MSKILRSFLLVFGFFLLLSFLFAGFDSTALSSKKLSLSQALQMVKEQKADSVIVFPGRIEVVSKDKEVFTADREQNVSFIETLKNFGFSEEEIGSLNLEVKEESGLAVWLAVLLPILLPALVIVGFFMYSLKRANQGAMQIFSFSRSNIKLFSPNKDRITFNDVAGLEEAKEELKEVVDFLKNPKKFQDLGARIPRGVLLMGPPGSGKTLLARATAGEAKVPFFHISGSEFVEMFVGVGAGRVRDAFTTAKKAAPSILFIDEIDAIGRERGSGIGGGHDEREQTLNQILVEMDGFDRDTNVIVIAATNRPDILDSALLRPGRFDRRVILDLPDIKEREEILKIHSRGKTFSSSVNLREIAERTPGFSGADLSNLTNEAAILAARRSKKAIEQSELLDSIEKVILGPERKSKILTEKEKEITAYHEAGHALISTLLPGAAKVRKVSIITRGRAAGYTMRTPSEERYMKTRSEFLDDLCALLGGYVAEELKFGEMSTGAANDLKEASSIARSLVVKYGMSKKMGPVAFGQVDDLMLYGKDYFFEKNYSEATAAKIDEEIMETIKLCYLKTKKLMRENNEKLKKVAEELIKKETLEKEDFEKLI
ncbi:MAG: ATP-dependent zinc metalloprotease FtsH [Candidatus Paceibacterota bacterium]|nr:ATP-dependent zinc metalloprotease FtsH [Candidatus Paceibacterota bacterium]MDD3548619.1 ATP-dependent zinc metalloprotease FtsH [Candidatus Paceibacterota bacterium]MDD4998998.1 ATP-dependent zinc metalloprotease FtsH [Candidatus Paceibacterota bacterium]MDD5545154.1 ATP-dependent zinc metalloprotease FtsH [Candidatus Paceibacterota bacterium]